LAKTAVDLRPKNGQFWNTLGLAQYRAGKWQEAIAAAQKSMELRDGGDASDWFILAMAYQCSGQVEDAHHWYRKAVNSMDKNKPKDKQLERFRAEAGELLELKKHQTRNSMDN
jgi:tetratricopeptide (TPR) repeat protein